MRSIRRLLTATAVGVAMTAASIAVAGPAAASPEDGQGCAGTPTVPASYVCLISLTPANALPTTTSTPVPVTVPPVCYVLGCTAATTVNVPVPSAGLNNGDVAVLWYQGRTYPIGVALGGQVVTIAMDAVDLARDTIDGLPNTTQVLQAVLRAVAPYLDYVNGVVAGVNETIDNLPTTTEILQAVVRALAPYVDAVNELRDNLPTANELVAAVLAAVDRYVDAVNELREGLPTTQDVLRIIRDSKHYELVMDFVQFVLSLLPSLS